MTPKTQLIANEINKYDDHMSAAPGKNEVTVIITGKYFREFQIFVKDNKVTNIKQTYGEKPTKGSVYDTLNKLLIRNLYAISDSL